MFKDVLINYQFSKALTPLWDFFFPQNCSYFEFFHKYFYRSLLVFNVWFSAFSCNLAFQELFWALIAFCPMVTHQPPCLVGTCLFGFKASQSHSVWKHSQEKKNPIYFKRKFLQKAYIFNMNKYLVSPVRSNGEWNDQTLLARSGISVATHCLGSWHWCVSGICKPEKRKAK